jgi:hypothetical protein
LDLHLRQVQVVAQAQRVLPLPLPRLVPVQLRLPAATATYKFCDPRLVSKPTTIVTVLIETFLSV